MTFPARNTLKAQNPKRGRFAALRKSVATVAAAAAIFGLVGCDEGSGNSQPIDSATAQQSLEANLEANLVGAAASLDWVSESQVADMGFGLVSFGGELGSEPSAAEPDFDPNGDPLPPIEGEGEGGSLSQDVAQMVDQLMEEVFVPQNIESETSTSVTYLMPGPDCGAPDCGGGEPEVRFRVTSPSDGNVNIAILLGPDKLEVAVIGVFVDQLSLEADLTNISAIVPPEQNLTVAGRVKATLRKDAPEKFTAEFAVTRDVEIKMVGEGGNLNLKIGSADPMLSATTDGANKTLGFAMDVGAIDLSFPGNLFGGEQTCSSDPSGEVFCEDVSSDPGFFEIHVGGLDGSATLTGADDQVEFKGLGLGDTTTTVAVDGSQVLAIDVNKNAGRSFDATISHDGEGVTIEVEPSFELAVALAFSGLDGDSEPWMDNDTLAVALTGTKPTIRMVENVIEIVQGQLSLSSNDHAVDAGAGSCLTFDESAEESAHPFAGWSSGACE